MFDKEKRTRVQPLFFHNKQMYWPPINTIYYSVRIVLSSFVDYLQFNFWLANKCLLIFRLSAKLIKRSQSTHKRVRRLLHEVKRKIPSRNNSNFEFSNTKHLINEVVWKFAPYQLHVNFFQAKENSDRNAKLLSIFCQGLGLVSSYLILYFFYPPNFSLFSKYNKKNSLIINKIKRISLVFWCDWVLNFCVDYQANSF